MHFSNYLNEQHKRQPITDRFKPYAKDWYVSNKIFDQVIKAILDEVTVDRTYNIPYVAGYSKDGNTIYIDKDMPKSFKTTKGKLVETDQYLILHEAIEKTLLDRFKFPYQFAHQVALRLERDAVEADGVTWAEYNKFMMAQVDVIGKEKVTKVPKNLDEKPYEDEDDSKTLHTLKKMMDN